MITTDGTWHVLPGAWLPGVQRDEEGDPVDYTENINGPAEPLGWDKPGFAAQGWQPATVIGPHPTAPWTHLVSVRTRIVYEPVHAVSRDPPRIRRDRGRLREGLRRDPIGHLPATGCARPAGDDARRLPP